MKSIISVMSEIEKEASEIVNNASNKKTQMYKELEDKISKIDEKYSEKLKNDIENLYTKCSNVYQKEIQKVQLNTDKEIDELEKTYELKYTQYISDLFNKVIEV